MHGVTNAELGNFTLTIQIESFFQEQANEAVALRKAARGNDGDDLSNLMGDGDVDLTSNVAVADVVLGGASEVEVEVVIKQ